jgi:chromosome segregation ATPase
MAQVVAENAAQAVPHALPFADLLSEIQRQFNALTQIADTAQQEIPTLRRRLADAHGELARVQGDLVQRSEQLSAAKEQLAHESAKLSGLEQRLTATESIASEAKQKNEEEIRILKSRIETEAARAVDNFKHTLGEAMRIEHNDFKTIEQSPMTLELGDSLRRQLAAIFNLHQQKGVIKKV